MPAEKEGVRDLESEESDTEEPVHLFERIEEELDLLARNVDILEKLANSPPIGIIRLSEALRRRGGDHGQVEGVLGEPEPVARADVRGDRPPQETGRRAREPAAFEPERLLARCRLGTLGAAVAQR